MDGRKSYNRLMLKPLRLLVLLALIAVGLLAGCGSDDAGGGSSGGASGDPIALLKKAFATEVESGELELKMNVDVKGSAKVPVPVSVVVKGPFESRGKGKPPLVDWDIVVSGAGQDFSGGIVATEDNAFVKFRGQTYEVGKQLYEQIVRQQEQQSKSGPQTLQELGVDPSDWVEDATVSDGESVGGDATRKVAGKVDVAAMIDDILEAAESPAIRKQLEGTGRSFPEISDGDKAEGGRRDRRGQLHRERGRRGRGAQGHLVGHVRRAGRRGRRRRQRRATGLRVRAAEGGRRRGHHRAGGREAAGAAAPAAGPGVNLPGGGLRTQ